MERYSQDLSNGILHAPRFQKLQSLHRKETSAESNFRKSQSRHGRFETPKRTAGTGSPFSTISRAHNIPLERYSQDLSNGILHAPRFQKLQSLHRKETPAESNLRILNLVIFGSPCIQVLLVFLDCRYRHCDFGSLLCSSFACLFGLPVPALPFWVPLCVLSVCLLFLDCRYRHCDFGSPCVLSFACLFGLPVPALPFWVPLCSSFACVFATAGTGTAILGPLCSSFASVFGLPVPALRFWVPLCSKFCLCFWTAGTGTAILGPSCVLSVACVFGLPVPALRFWVPLCSSFACVFGLPVPALRFWVPLCSKFCLCFWTAGTGTAILGPLGVLSFASVFGLPVPALPFWVPYVFKCCLPFWTAGTGTAILGPFVFKFCLCFWTAGTGNAILAPSGVQVLLAFLDCQYFKNNTIGLCQVLFLVQKVRPQT